MECDVMCPAGSIIPARIDSSINLVDTRGKIGSKIVRIRQGSASYFL